MFCTQRVPCIFRYGIIVFRRDFQTGNVPWVKNRIRPLADALPSKISREDEKAWRDMDFQNPSPIGKEFEKYNLHPEMSEEQVLYEVEREKKREEHLKAKMKIMRELRRPKREPLMVTWNEKQHMRNLHEMDPEEWTPERISESFPVLPFMVKAILKSKWIPESIEQMKKKDMMVLENWEKLKRKELDISPKYLKHVKKFIDRVDNLRAQIRNEEFSQLEESTKPKEQFFSEEYGKKSLIAMYRKEMKKLVGDQKALPAGEDKSVAIMPVRDQDCKTIVEEKIEMRKPVPALGGKDTFLIGGIRKEKNKTLDKLKEEVVKASEKEKKKLTDCEKDILEKIISKGESLNHGKISLKRKESGSESDIDVKREESVGESHLETKQSSCEVNFKGEGTSGEISPRKKESSGKTYLKRKQTRNEISEERSDVSETESPPVVDETDEYKFLMGKIIPAGYSRVLFPEEIGRVIAGTKENSEGAKEGVREAVSASLDQHVEEEERKTEVEQKEERNELEDQERKFRDAQYLANMENAVTGTGFWNEKVTRRTASKDAGFALDNPHLSASLKTYVTYNYPKKIKIPKNLWEEGLIYRIKDCYYDDDGLFLYRVPGMWKNE